MVNYSLISLALTDTHEMIGGVIQPPWIAGLVSINSDKVHYVMKTLAPCEIASISHTRLYELCTSENLWELLARQLQAMADRLIVSTLFLQSANAYGLVRFHLYELMKEPEWFRLTVTAEKYIRLKTRLSRSGVLRMLSALKTGGYIIIDEGILKEIKLLPKRF